MITANVFQRIFFIRYGSQTGTAFTVDQEGRQYLVSARHLCPDLEGTGHIEVCREGVWEPISVTVVGAGRPGELAEDVIVLATPRQLSPSLPMPATSAGLIWGQQVYFLGFPYGMSNHIQMHGGYPLPLIKQATMSGTVGQKLETFLLDGHNNPGFSGGPAVFKPINSDELRVFGIISAYRTQQVEITFEGKPTGLSSVTNTGIVVCPSIKRATDFIEANPIGPNVMG